MSNQHGREVHLNVPTQYQSTCNPSGYVPIGGGGSITWTALIQNIMPWGTNQLTTVDLIRDWKVKKIVLRQYAVLFNQGYIVPSNTAKPVTYAISPATSFFYLDLSSQSTPLRYQGVVVD